MNGPDQRVFEADVAKAAFRLGEVEGRWQLIKMAWPYAFMAVTAKDGREYVHAAWTVPATRRYRRPAVRGM